MAKVLFVSEDYIKENTYIDTNVDAKLLRSIIYSAQRLYIKPIIGSGIYTDLETGITANNLVVGGVNYTTLLQDYVQPALEYWVLCEAMIPLTMKLRNKGVQTQNSDNSQPVPFSQLKEMESHWRDKAEYFSERVTLFLCENASTYPKFDNPGNGVDIIHPNKDNFTCSIYLDEGNQRCEIDSYIDLQTGQTKGKLGS